MKATALFRIAAVLFVLFAVGHTLGFLTFKPPSAEGLAAMEAMNRAHFEFGGANRSYGDFYVGFGLFVSLYLVFSAFLSWHLSGLARTAPQAIGMLGWAFFMVQVVNLILSLIYFGAPPVLFAVLLVLSLGWAMLALPKAVAAR